MPRRTRSIARDLAVALLVYAALLAGAVALMAHGEQERDVSAATVPEVVYGLLHHPGAWLGRTVLVAGTPGGSSSMDCVNVLLAAGTGPCYGIWEYLVDASNPIRPSAAVMGGSIAYFAGERDLPVSGGCHGPDPAPRVEDLRAVYRMRLVTSYSGTGGVGCTWERPYRPTGPLALAWGRALGWLGLAGGRS